MPFAAAIFDLDGTLVDSLEDIGRAMNHALAAHGLPVHPLSAYRDFVGEGVARLVARAAPQADAAARAGLLERYHAHYAEHLLDHTRPFPGVPEVLAACAGRGLRLAVLSNKGHAYTRELVGRLLPAVPFAEVWGEQPGLYPRKPDPASALALAARLGVSPGACAFVGDTSVDMHTARNAGMAPVGVTWGFRPGEVRAAPGAVLAENALALARLLAE